VALYFAKKMSKDESQYLFGGFIDHSKTAIWLVLYNGGLNFALYGFQTVFSTYFSGKAFQNVLNLDARTAGLITNSLAGLVWAAALVGGFMSDTYWGPFKTIIIASATLLISTGILLLGNLLNLFLDSKSSELSLVILSFVGAVFFVISAGFVKACISTFLGAQFAPSQGDKRTTYFGWYYWSIQV
jgi:dipeptide/tripeptide permease